MPLEKFDYNMDIVSSLGDEPNDIDGLSASELKAKFDEGGKAVKDYINDTLTVEIEEGYSTKGELEGVREEIQDVVLGQIPDGTITKEKLSADVIETIDSKAPAPILGTTPPTEETVGVVGQLYLDTETRTLYQCVAAEDGAYEWEIPHNPDMGKIKVNTEYKPFATILEIIVGTRYALTLWEFTPDGTKLIFVINNRIKMINLSTMTVVQSPFTVTSNDNGSLIIDNDAGVYVFNGIATPFGIGESEIISKTTLSVDGIAVPCPTAVVNNQSGQIMFATYTASPYTLKVYRYDKASGITTLFATPYTTTTFTNFSSFIQVDNVFLFFVTVSSNKLAEVYKTVFPGGATTIPWGKTYTSSPSLSWVRYVEGNNQLYLYVNDGGTYSFLKFDLISFSLISENTVSEFVNALRSFGGFLYSTNKKYSTSNGQIMVVSDISAASTISFNSNGYLSVTPVSVRALELTSSVFSDSGNWFWVGTKKKWGGV